MNDRHAAARAALEAALAAADAASSTSGEPPVTPTRGRPPAWQPIPGDPEADPTTRGDHADPHDVARQIVLRQLASAPKSRKQLRDKLRQRHCPDEVAEAVLDRMTEVGLIDDEAYAGMVVRSQQAGRGLAARALARELRAKGVDEELAKATLDAMEPEQERERAEQLVTKRLKTMHGLDPTVQRRRLAGMLARKGYASDLSMTVIREALARCPEHQRD
jgi:regulatory protein